MIIKQDPVSGLYCRSDGAVLMPPVKRSRFKTFRWAFGSNDRYGYKTIGFQRKIYLVHQIVCRAFNGLSPEDKPFVDHINRIKSDNRPENLRWVNRKENGANQDKVDLVLERYGVRHCEDRAAYDRAYYEVHREESRAHYKAYCERHREKIRARNRAWSKAHYRAYYEAHCEEIKARSRAWSKAHYEHHK